MTAILLRAVFYLSLTAVFIVLTQTTQIFPGALFSVFSNKKVRDPKTLPPDVTSSFIETVDGKALEVWKLEADPEVPKKPYVGIVFHGNGGTVENFFLVQLWFREQGMNSYGFDYRGYGKSTGWPSEQGIAYDSDAVWDYVLKAEGIGPEQVIVCGVSVGGAPAARIASLHQPHLLLLVAPFVSIDRMIKERFYLKPLARFSWNKFPTFEYVSKLKRTSLVLLHGADDGIIPPEHSDALAGFYSGDGSLTQMEIPKAGHNNVFFMAWRELSQKVAPLL